MMILRARLRGQMRRPGGLHIIEHERNELHGGLFRRILRGIRLARFGLRRASAAAEQRKEIHFENETQDQQDDGAADADMKAAELKTAATAAFIAAIFDVGTFAAGSP